MSFIISFRDSIVSLLLRDSIVSLLLRDSIVSCDFHMPLQR